MRLHLFIGVAARPAVVPGRYVVRLISSATTLQPVRNMAYQALAAAPDLPIRVYDFELLGGATLIWRSLGTTGENDLWSRVEGFDATLTEIVAECLLSAYPSMFGRAAEPIIVQ